MSTDLIPVENQPMQVELDDPSPERRATITLTAEQLEQIAEAAADKAVAKITDHVYRQVGKGILTKFVWIVGGLGTALYLWLGSKGLIKIL